MYTILIRLEKNKLVEITKKPSDMGQPRKFWIKWELVRGFNAYLWPNSDFTGRNLMPIFDGVLGLLDETAGNGQSVQEVLGDDIKGFCSALAGEEGAKSYLDK